jgi:hypothetical protein
MLRYEWPLVALGLRVEADATADEARVSSLVAHAAELTATTPQDRAQQALAAAEAARANLKGTVPFRL